MALRASCVRPREDVVFRSPRNVVVFLRSATEFDYVCVEKRWQNCLLVEVSLLGGLSFILGLRIWNDRLLIWPFH